jgi:aspartate aminotransferase
MSFTQRSQKVQASQTMAITALVDSLRREGKDILDLGAGEPDFDTPDVIKEAGIRAIQQGFTKYTPASGTLELKKAICEKIKTDYGIEYSPPEILVTCGAKHAVVNVLLALCEQGDEVIIPAPYWTSYPEQVRFVDATPVILETDESTDFKISPKQLENAVNSNTKLLILNSPSNPTGSVYTQSELFGLAEVIRKHNFHVLSDEIYDKIIYDGLNHVSLAAFPELRDRVILVNGVSKSYAMTGWRIGYMAGNSELIKAAAKIQSHTTSNPCSISQKASIAALQADEAIVAEMVGAFDRRRKYLAEQLTAIPKIKCNLPKGAFYMFPNVSGYFGCKHNDKTIENSMDFCSFLLPEAGIAFVPGEAFGSSRNVRISYATSMENLRETISRLTRALVQLRNQN